ATGTPANGILGCNPTTEAIGAALGTATATDNCGSVSPTFVDGTISIDGCLRSQTRTWNVTDACGNKAIPVSRTASWTVDTEKPVIIATGTPANGILGCNPTTEAIGAALGTATATDNCGSVSPTFVDGTISIDGCLRSQTRTWNVTDACGNKAIPVSRTASWTVDTTPPVITCAADKVIDCNTTISFTDPTATDNCSGAITITVVSTVTNPDGSQTRTWKAEDACGNSATCSQKISKASCSHIFPTQTTCCNYATGTATGLYNVCTKVTGNVVNNVIPGVFFYYSNVVAPAASFTIEVKQSNDGDLNKLFSVHGYDKNNLQQIRLYTSSCGDVNFTGSFINSGKGAKLVVTGATPGATYIVSIKYEVKSIIGATYTGSDKSSKYTFGSSINGTLDSGSVGTIDAVAGCSDNTPLPGDCTMPSPTSFYKSDSTEAKTATEAVFEAYPIPFKDQLTIRYKFDYISDVKIEVFNSQGVLILAKTDAKGYLDKEITLNLNTSSEQEQVYVVKVTTNRGSSVKKVMSSK
ncbi:T9SS type A sorting domain-containing protein, partial [Flavobacterium soyangense]